MSIHITTLRTSNEWLIKAILPRLGIHFANSQNNLSGYGSSEGQPESATQVISFSDSATRDAAANGLTRLVQAAGGGIEVSTATDTLAAKPYQVKLVATGAGINNLEQALERLNDVLGSIQEKLGTRQPAAAGMAP